MSYVAMAVAAAAAGLAAYSWVRRERVPERVVLVADFESKGLKAGCESSS